MNLNQRSFADSTVRKRLQSKNYFLTLQLITKIWSWGERIVQESLNNANKYAKASGYVDLMLDDKHLKARNSI